MLYRDICRILSHFLLWLNLPLAIPLLMAAYMQWFADPTLYPQPPATMAFLATMVVNVLLAFLFRILGKKSAGTLFRREALLLVLFIWLITPAVSCLPFLFSKTLKNPIDAYFEAVAGYTTTGATILCAKEYNPNTGKEEPIEVSFCVGEPVTYKYFGTVKPVRNPKTNKVLFEGIEAVNPALLFWRSLMQWIGGGGIVVLFVAILPALGVGGKILYQTEITGPSKESVAPRIKDTASQLWKVYLGLTALQVALLMITNREISLLEATTISLSTISTGGFTAKNDSIGYFNNPYTDWVVIAFMILGSVSFSLYFFCMRGRFSRLNDPELKAFLIIILCTSLFSAWQLTGTPVDGLNPDGPTFSFWEGLRYGAFQVISTQTSTGFTTISYRFWPFSIQVLMLIVMFVGAMAGSTAGGLKVVRSQMFFRIMLQKIESIFRPDTVRTYRLGHAVIDNRVAMTVLCFFMVAASLTIVGTFLLVLEGIDPETSITVMGSLINNIGIAFRAAGPGYSFAFLSNNAKLLGCFWMIAGRLEFFAVLVAFVPAFWRTR